MYRILLIAFASTETTRLRAALTQQGFACLLATEEGEVTEQVAEQSPDLVLLEVQHPGEAAEQTREIKRVKTVPVIVLVPREVLRNINGHLEIDDFVLQPCDVTELTMRMKRLLQKAKRTEAGELVTCGDLVLDLARCQVTVSGRLAELTFREYELLRFLLHNRGRVFTREALLNKVWGYDYFGGDRTVDVHIRRLRSKIEDPNHTFIETVRNIGYRFKES